MTSPNVRYTKDHELVKLESNIATLALPMLHNRTRQLFSKIETKGQTLTAELYWHSER